MGPRTRGRAICLFLAKHKLIKVGQFSMSRRRCNHRLLSKGLISLICSKGKIVFNSLMPNINSQLLRAERSHIWNLTGSIMMAWMPPKMILNRRSISQSMTKLQSHQLHKTEQWKPQTKTPTLWVETTLTIRRYHHSTILPRHLRRLSPKTSRLGK